MEKVGCTKERIKVERRLELRGKGKSREKFRIKKKRIRVGRRLE